MTDSSKTIVFCHNTTKYIYLHYEALLDRLLSLGYEVVCISPADDFVERLLRPGVIHLDWGLSQHGMNPFIEIVSIVKLRKLLKTIKPAKIVTFSIKPNLYTALVRIYNDEIRQYCMITGLGYVFLGSGWLRKILKSSIVMMYKLLFSRNIHAVFQNAEDQSLFTSHKLIQHSNTSVISGTGVDTNYFINEHDYVFDRIRFIFIGRLLADKGLNELLQAASELDRSKCSITILGPFDNNPGAISKTLVQSAIDDGVVHYYGETTDVRPFLKNADVFVLPSYREGLSRSILEAMSSGLGVITTDVPGCRELVTDGFNGIVVPVKNTQALKVAMQRMLDNHQLIKTFGLNSRKRILETYAIEKVTAQIIGILGLGTC